MQIYIYVYLCGSAFLISTENQGKRECCHTKQNRVQVCLYSSEQGMEVAPTVNGALLVRMYGLGLRG